MKEYSARDNVGGILTPDVNGLRMIYNLRTKEYFPFQTLEPGPEDVRVGRFYLLRSAFELAQQILLNELLLCPSYLVIDEVGKLEVHRHNGLEPALGQVIEWYMENELDSELILVIRDSLLEDAAKKYKI